MLKNKEQEGEFAKREKERQKHIKWVGFGVLLLAFLFALPYLFEHTTKTVTEYKNLKVAIKKG